MNTNLINVVAAVREHEGRYWTCRRSYDGGSEHLAGMWEYPGGKVEEGESLEDALVREMREEFDVAATVGRKIDTVITQLAEGARNVYAVHFFSATFTGEPRLTVHDQFAWLTPVELIDYQHLPSGQVFNRLLLAGEYLREQGVHPKT